VSVTFPYGAALAAPGSGCLYSITSSATEKKMAIYPIPLDNIAGRTSSIREEKETTMTGRVSWCHGATYGRAFANGESDFGTTRLPSNVLTIEQALARARGDEDMKKLILGVLVTVAAASSSFANSCTTQGQECKSWAQGQGAQAGSYATACAREVSACISRCKGGNKVFVGVYKGAGGGQQYPISECK
jgi:hypothetical protein